MREQRSVGPVDGVAFGQRDMRHGVRAAPDVRQYRGAHICTLACWVSTHDTERPARGELLVSGACRQHDDVSRPRGDDHAAVAAELHRYLTAIDAERLVRVSVKVVERVDAVAPRGRPTVAVEQRLEGRSRVRALDRDRAGVHQQRPARVIGDCACRREAVRSNALDIVLWGADVEFLQTLRVPDPKDRRAVLD